MTRSERVRAVRYPHGEASTAGYEGDMIKHRADIVVELTTDVHGNAQATIREPDSATPRSASPSAMAEHLRDLASTRHRPLVVVTIDEAGRTFRDLIAAGRSAGSNASVPLGGTSQLEDQVNRGRRLELARHPVKVAIVDGRRDVPARTVSRRAGAGPARPSSRSVLFVIGLVGFGCLGGAVAGLPSSPGAVQDSPDVPSIAETEVSQ